MTDFARQPRQKQPLADPTAVDRLPPHSLEAEQGVLSCILQAPDECVPECINRMLAGSECFYDLRHRTIYEACLAMYDLRQPVEIITLMQWLKDRQQLEAVGGLVYLSSLVDAAPSAANIEYYTEIILEKFALRGLVKLHTEGASMVYDHEGEVTEIIDAAERGIAGIRQQLGGGSAPQTAKQLVRASLTIIEEMHARQGALVGVGSGFADLDRMTGGFRAGDLVVIAGRPSMGKSSCAVNIAEHVAVELRLPVGIFSLEMTAVSLMLRALCSRARVNLRTIQAGVMTERDFSQLTTVAAKVASAPIHIDDSSSLTAMQLRARARRLHQQHGIKLLIIDYLQLLRAGERTENRQQEITLISGGIKSLAKELSIPIIALSQLSRDIEKEKNRQPRLSDLRESGAIEQDADVVGILYRPSEPNSGVSESSDAISVNLWIGKQRNGPTGDVPLTFLRQYTRFESAARIDSGDIPSNRDIPQPHND